ncbi:S-adenosyl-L-methionine-dependent methyltransferase [Dichotomopilus funicola]|uniref:S-adenosyl-L-methionine-dependent methyltransferase n=1 Tax=Dichotomopilus funicola TaxID=1934379 RepID=A0AAN6V7G7_9PEZI|nr:S-adenosyl-L-methionine-dependent methyltransferase [Dichotomopilus funicola]
MSLYHETASLLTTPSPTGSLKSRIYNPNPPTKPLKSPPAQIYALAFESSKWSPILKEVVEHSQLLHLERKLTPPLAILLTHDLLLAKKGIALPASHGLRVAVERHRARLQAELSRARVRRGCASLEELRGVVDGGVDGGEVHPRWIRVNGLKSSVNEQLDTTFRGFEVVKDVGEVMKAVSPFTGKGKGQGPRRVICLDPHIPNLIAASPGSMDFTKTAAYQTGAIILQDKASCFPAYLLDPRPGDGDVVDACSAPGNKTTHLAAILHERRRDQQKILAFEKDKRRAQTLVKMVRTAGSDGITVVHPGADFLKTDPFSAEMSRVGALLLDPSCSGSGIVGRDDTPEFHLPEMATSTGGGKNGSERNSGKKNLKRKRAPSPPPPPTAATVLVDDDGTETVVASEKALEARLEALASFQLALLQHALTFPHATRVTYSTCSIHARENEHVVLAALRWAKTQTPSLNYSPWRLLPRSAQIRGMRDWPVRGDIDACEGDEEAAQACIRAQRGDGRGTMGFFVACFVRDLVPGHTNTSGSSGDAAAIQGGDDDGPYVRDAEGRIVRDEQGIPMLKGSGRKAVDLGAVEGDVEVRFGGDEEDEEDGPFERDSEGRIVRGEDGMPVLKGGRKDDEEDEEAGGEWGGFED